MKKKIVEMQDELFEIQKERILDELKIKWYDVVIVIGCISIVIGWLYYLLFY